MLPKDFALFVKTGGFQKLTMKTDRVKLPHNAIIWENYINAEGEIEYVIATKDLRTRDTYLLYHKDGEGKWEKIKTSSSPDKLQKFINMQRRD